MEVISKENQGELNKELNGNVVDPKFSWREAGMSRAMYRSREQISIPTAIEGGQTDKDVLDGAGVVLNRLKQQEGFVPLWRNS